MNELWDTLGGSRSSLWDRCVRSAAVLFWATDEQTNRWTDKQSHKVTGFQILTITSHTLRTRYCRIKYSLVSICDLQRLTLYWFHAPGLQLDNEVSQSTDQLHGTVCHQHYGHRTCRRAPSSGRWRRTCSWPPGAIETSSWFWRRI